MIRCWRIGLELALDARLLSHFTGTGAFIVPQPSHLSR